MIMNSKTVFALRHVIYICFRLFSESFQPLPGGLA